MNILKRLFTTDPVYQVVDSARVPEAQRAVANGMVSARQRYVQIWVPPTAISESGETGEGINESLMARYMVATVERMVGTKFGNVEVTWSEMHGRFVTTLYNFRSWGQTVLVVHPVRAVSGDIQQMFELYQSGIAEKVGQIHKGEQNFGPSNDRIRRALDMLDRLRNNAEDAHFNAEEYAFLFWAMTGALTMNAMVPTPKAGEAANIMGRTVRVSPGTKTTTTPQP